MVITFLLSRPLSSEPTLILIRLAIPLPASSPLDIVSYLGLLWFHGAVRINMLLIDLVLKLSIVLLLILHLNFSGYDDFCLTWVFLNLLVLSFIVTIKVPYRLLIMMYSMNVPNISRLIVLSSSIIFSMVFCIFILSPLKINWLTPLQNLIHRNDSMILSPNSSWLCLIEFEERC
jgi:hypothetical protein